MELYKDYPGFVGLFYASLLSAALSTLSSGLSSISAMFWEDIAKPLAGEITQSRAILITKISVAVTGCLCVALSFFAAEIGGTLMQVTATMIGTFSAPKVGVFIAGILCPWTNGRSAIFGALVGFSIVNWYALGKFFAKLPPFTNLSPGPTDNCTISNGTRPNATYITHELLENSTYTLQEDAAITRELSWVEQFYTISYHYSAPMGIMATILMTNVFSLFCGYVKRAKSDYRYVSSFTDGFFCCLPNSWLRCLNCGYKRTSLNSEDNNEKENAEYAAPIDFEKVDQFPVPYDLPPFYERVISEKDRSPVFAARFDANKGTVLLE